MALWEAPITATVASDSEGMVRARRGGFKAGSRPISWILVKGREPVVGEEPVQSTTMLEVMFKGPGNFSSGELILTFQLLGCLVY
jgi:hypothetical protein